MRADNVMLAVIDLHTKCRDDLEALRAELPDTHDAVLTCHAALTAIESCAVRVQQYEYERARLPGNIHTAVAVHRSSGIE